MLLRVVAESPEKFKGWLDNERKPAVNDASVRTDKYDVFLKQSCVSCHPVRGTENETPARKRGYAPDLTHLMRRNTLATLAADMAGESLDPTDSDRNNLRRWVRDPQKIKPGCLMPGFGQLSAKELESVVNY